MAPRGGGCYIRSPEMAPGGGVIFGGVYHSLVRCPKKNQFFYQNWKFLQIWIPLLSSFLFTGACLKIYVIFHFIFNFFVAHKANKGTRLVEGLSPKQNNANPLHQSNGFISTFLKQMYLLHALERFSGQNGALQPRQRCDWDRNRGKKKATSAKNNVDMKQMPGYFFAAHDQIHIFNAPPFFF